MINFMNDETFAFRVEDSKVITGSTSEEIATLKHTCSVFLKHKRRQTKPKKARKRPLILNYFVQSAAFEGQDRTCSLKWKK